MMTCEVKNMLKHEGRSAMTADQANQRVACGSKASATASYSHHQVVSYSSPCSVSIKCSSLIGQPHQPIRYSHPESISNSRSSRKPSPDVTDRRFRFHRHQNLNQKKARLLKCQLRNDPWTFLKVKSPNGFCQADVDLLLHIVSDRRYLCNG